MSQVVSCPSCNRNNGLARTTCIYCGVGLPASEETLALRVPTLRPVEEWESGFSVVVAPLDQESPAPNQIARLAEVTRMEEATASAVLSARTPLPVARVSTAEEADLIARLLGESDVGATVVADADLDMTRNLRRARELRLGDDALEVHVTWGDWVAIPRDEVALAVEGRVVSTQMDLVEGVGKRRGTFDLVDTAQYFLESYAIDIFGPTLESSYRIKADGFDFGCLGRRPSHRLDENVAALGAALAGYLGPSRYDAEYARVARLLDHAWPRASRVASRGLGRKGDFRKYTVSSVTTDALAQFTRYARTRYRLARP